MEKEKKTLAFNEILNGLIEQEGINPAYFAYEIEARPSQVSEWLAGNSKPSFDYLKKIADYFNISADILLGIKPYEGGEYKFAISSRRYSGSQTRLTKWIGKTIRTNCENCHSFCDLFAGTGVVTDSLYNYYDRFILNDFLYSNEVIYKGFFENQTYSEDKILQFKDEYDSLNPHNIKENYVSKNFGNLYINNDDAKTIGYIRNDLEENKDSAKLNDREYSILLASLLYSVDRCANKLGHYDTYVKGQKLEPQFKFELIRPKNTINDGKKVEIYREDANELISKLTSDIIYIDPPYTSKQYSRYYHVLETITKWDKPKLTGDAKKPPLENMSKYSQHSAFYTINNLINSVPMSTKYIVLSYDNGTGWFKENCTLEAVYQILSRRGETKIFDMNGELNTPNSKEKYILLITKVTEKPFIEQIKDRTDDMIANMNR